MIPHNKQQGANGKGITHGDVVTLQQNELALSQKSPSGLS